MPGRLRTARPRASLRQGRDWYRIKNLGNSAAEVVIYDEIGWFGVTAEDFMAELRGLDVGEITLRVNSPGGEIFDGIAIHNLLRSHRAQVTTYVDSLAASIASVIALAGDRVIMQPHSQMMIHDGSGLAIGNAADMREMADLLDRQSNNIAEVYAERAGGTVEDWRQRMLAETWYSAKEAVAAGLADEVAETRQRPDEGEPNEPAPNMAATWDLSIFRYTGRAEAPAPDAPAVANTAAPTHHTDTADGTWDAGAQEKKLDSPMPVATAKKMYGWYDGKQVEDGKVPKSACKLPHHQVSDDGAPGAAVLNGVRNALSRLPQSDIPEGEQGAVESHLRAHLKDGGAGEEDHAEPGLSAATAEPSTPAAPEPEPLAMADEPADDWAALTAHLTTEQDDAGDWSALVSQLTQPEASPAATDA
ncbi:head maturation protease, ClpP-related [Streptomyces sp. Inha503]|uniref:head maturation protease, ClpP-related n=1 Tax=Streptomyces sp. Inha503 TaxID=3383314 RepID=UPI0039A3D8D9